MKKLLALLLIVCLLATSVFTGSVYAADAAYNLSDVNKMAQYMAGWDVNINETELDYNCDGKVNLKDLVLLAQFVAGWNVVIGNGSNSIIPEEDAFGDSISVEVTPVDGKVPAGGVVISGGGISATVPEGVLLNDGTTTLTLKITYLDSADGGITAGENEELVPLDVHIEGVSKNNTVPIIINMGKVLPEGLNLGNYKFFHVEDGEAKTMTLVDDVDALTKHNTFIYDANTGEVSVAMATFSTVAMVFDTTNVWNGGIDNSWYNEEATNLNIANGDQLNSFSKKVGEGVTFEGKTIKLISDIDLADDEENNDPNKIFYPIGYTYDEKNGSDILVFKGTFDGNGHTIKNFYQNTWEMLGDYSGHYYKDAMGLFAWVDGTVKNLTVENFSSDGEYTPTGVIAAYAAYDGNATFENIAITDCNPRVYNTGNGGIVGIAGNADEENKITLKNITVDSSNKITALWGSWDVACGGLIGMFRGKYINNETVDVTMTNCHVAAQIDVFNDVCGNYQYYWYRYAGMLVGTNKNMYTDNKGYTVPRTSQYKTENCTVHFGDWNNYYYCELVENSLASYTHDHQFSRLTEIKSKDEIQNEDGWTTTGNFYIKDGETVTCYHIRKNADGILYEHKHENAGYETSIDEDNDGNVDLKEDKQVVYLPFNQLFTGYGWGAKHVPVYNEDETYAFDGVTILDNHDGYSVEKFQVKENVIDSYKTGMTVSIGKLFEAIEGITPTIMSSSVQVFVSPADEYSNVSATFTPSTTDDWQDATVTFSGTGLANITITDYYFCKPTTFTVNVTTISDTDAYLNNLIKDENDNWNWNMFSISVPTGTYNSDNKEIYSSEYEIPGFNTNGNDYLTTNIATAHNSSSTYKIEIDNTYGRTDNTSIAISGNGQNTYIKLPNLKANTDYTFTFYYSGIGKTTITSNDKEYHRLLATYHLFTPEVPGASFGWGGDGCLHSASYNYSYDSPTGLFANAKKEYEKYTTSAITIVEGKGNWNKVQIKFNSLDFGDNLYFIVSNSAKTVEQRTRWIDDISLVETKNWNNDASRWNEASDAPKTIPTLVDVISNGSAVNKVTYARVKYINYADAPEKLTKYPGVEDYIHLSQMGGPQTVTMKLNVEQNTKYKIHFNYLSTDGVSSNKDKTYYYHLSSVAILGDPVDLPDEEPTRPIFATAPPSDSNNMLSFKSATNGFNNMNDTVKWNTKYNTQIDVSKEKQWQTMEIEFNSKDYTEVILYIAGGSTIVDENGKASAKRDIYLTNLEMTKID